MSKKDSVFLFKSVKYFPNHVFYLIRISIVYIYHPTVFRIICDENHFPFDTQLYTKIKYEEKRKQKEKNTSKTKPLTIGQSYDMLQVSHNLA